MVMIKRMLALLGSGALAILLLRQAETAAQAVRDGIQLCLTSAVSYTQLTLPTNSLV